MVQLKNEIEVPRESRAEEQEAMASAGVLDAKAASSSYLPANMDALTRAVAALEKGVAGVFFSVASVLPSGRSP